MSFSLPAETGTGTELAKTVPVWANFLAIEAFLNGLNVSTVKSNQFGTITISPGSATGTATITSVDVTKTLLNWLGESDDQATLNPSKALARITLTNATTVTATRNTTTTDTVIIGFQVMEFN